MAVLTQPKPVVIAPRSGSKESIENTIGAFQRAIKVGAARSETDIRLTTNGKVVSYPEDNVGCLEGMPFGQPCVADVR